MVTTSLRGYNSNFGLQFNNYNFDSVLLNSRGTTLMCRLGFEAVSWPCRTITKPWLRLEIDDSNNCSRAVPEPAGIRGTPAFYSSLDICTDYCLVTRTGNGTRRMSYVFFPFLCYIYLHSFTDTTTWQRGVSLLVIRANGMWRSSPASCHRNGEERMEWKGSPTSCRWNGNEREATGPVCLHYFLFSLWPRTDKEGTLLIHPHCLPALHQPSHETRVGDV